MLSETGHTILAATNPKMYKYFPITNEILNLNMTEGGLFLVSRTPQAVKILKDVVKCALIKDCMGPPYSTLYCNRYDQSAWSLSLAQCSTKITDFLGASDLIQIDRMSSNKIDAFIQFRRKFPRVTKTII